MQLRRTWTAGSAVRAILTALLFLGAAPHELAAQLGTISGHVANKAGLPLADARVLLVGTTVATSTNSEGRFTLRNVQPGAAEVRVLRVGYAEQKKAVAVSPGATATVEFTLAEAVVQLQEVVTTATGEQRKVELGNALSVISAPKRVEETPIHTVSDLLLGKAPGVILQPAAMAGAASTIRIRGLSSISLSNAPIMLIDGVRMNSGSIGGGVGGTSISFLNSLSPEEIEDIEIVKGPSAATLYGTDAANGVILVTTKKGKAGNARWTWFAQGGRVDDTNAYPATYALWGHNPTNGRVTRCQLATMTSTTCVPDSLTSLNIATDKTIGPIRPAPLTNYGAQVSGGSDAVRYFVSADMYDELGTYKMPDFAVSWLRDTLNTDVRDEWLHPEAFQRQNTRLNLSAALSPTFDLNVTGGFSKTNQRLPQVDNNVNGIGGAMYLTYGTNHAGLDYNPVGALGEDLKGYARYTPASVFQYLTTQANQRITGSADAQWRPLPWLQNAGTIGVDLSARNLFQLCRLAECPVFGSNRLGFVTNNHIDDRVFSAKLMSTASWNPRGWLNMKTTAGADYLNDETEASNASGTGLPPGAQTVNATTTKGASDTQPTATKTLGMYLQELFAARDRMFLTVAVRTDQNSAFGTHFERVFYPKAQLSWLMSEEPFFPQYGWMNSFRLRTAYGASGVQPGRTDALRTFSATTQNINNAPTAGLIENSLGNPDLKPETSAEIESGFDLRALNNRVNVEFTYYRKQTKDALIAVPIAASAAPSNLSVRANVASVRSWGEEGTITAQLIDRRSFGWSLTLNGSHNSSSILKLARKPDGTSSTIGTGASRDSLGFPINGLFVRDYTWSDANGDGIIQTAEVAVDTGVKYIGYSQPRDLISMQHGFDLLQRRLRINVLMDYKGGFNLFNSTFQFICQQAPQPCYEEQDKSAPQWRQARSVANLYGTVINGTRFTTSRGYYENGQFWKLREVSATWELPARIGARLLHTSQSSLTIGGRNLATFTKYTDVDPEANYSTGDTQNDFITQAPRRYLTVRLNLHY
jgi:TonB-linked SusC/RagA family outer membrane protein